MLVVGLAGHVNVTVLESRDEARRVRRTIVGRRRFRLRVLEGDVKRHASRQHDG